MNNYGFDPELAEKYGVNESIILWHLSFWISKNKSNLKHQHDGKTWTYNSVKAFSEIFKFWNAKQIERILNSLKEQHVIITGNYNQSPYDRTCWYAFSNEEEFISGTKIADLPKTGNGLEESGEPIPDNNTYIKHVTHFDQSTPEYKLATEMLSSIKKIGSSMKDPDLNKWAESFDKIHRIDKYAYDWIMELIDKVYSDNFWKNQIRSPEKLREQINAGKLDKLIALIKTWIPDESVLENIKNV